MEKFTHWENCIALESLEIILEEYKNESNRVITDNDEYRNLLHKIDTIESTIAKLQRNIDIERKRNNGKY